jgi:hypothetical protein
MMMGLPAKRAIARTVYEEADSICGKWNKFNSARSSASFCLHTFTAACWLREAARGTTVVNT